MCIIHRYKLNRCVYREVTPEYFTYGLEIYEEYICDKCGKVKYKEIDLFKCDFTSTLIDKIKRLEKYGFKSMYQFKTNK